jgi:hypothetical protein
MISLGFQLWANPVVLVRFNYKIPIFGALKAAFIDTLIKLAIVWMGFDVE